MTTDSVDVADGFAALMSEAAEDAGPAVEAPYGWTTDRSTGERRAKRAPGRPKKPPSLDELKAEREVQAESVDHVDASEDRAPSQGKHRRGKAKAAPGAVDAATPQHRPGLITKGVNKLYRRAGKVARALDKDIGNALMEISQNTSEVEGEDDSVGAAWDELARTNPRIRRFLLKLIAGGAWSQVIMAHGPLGMAVAMKFISEDPGLIGRLIKSVAEADEDTPAGEGGLPGGMTAEDVQSIFEMAGKFMPGMTGAEAADINQRAGIPDPPPPRSQPRNTPRAKRR
jgi:hypothetical protein